jgi:CRP-like cAMP-binding protein
MVTREDLKKLVVLGHLNDTMLDQLIPITDVLMFNAEETIFSQGDPADRFYMVMQGTVLLEQHISETITVSMSAIKPGFSFGWSAMLDEGLFTTDAFCEEDSRLLSFRAVRIKELIKGDPVLGIIFYQGLLSIIKKRYDIRTEQFIKVIQNHPDIIGLL